MATQTWLCEKTYLNLPVKNGAPKRRVRLILEDQVVREFEIELAESSPDFWVFLDLRPFRGKQATLEVEELAQDSPALQQIHQDDVIAGAEDLYREPLRPQFHFSTRRGWSNDPNGLVYYRGEYHLFYQHNPYGRSWGSMHWGHAVSPDLVHWEELPIALYPRHLRDLCFSGSATVDWQNTAGFQTGDEPPIVAAYTSTGRGECIAYSNDRGRTFTDYEGNPVVRHQGRDPKVIWYAPGNHWVMAVYDEIEDTRGIAFYTSPDLKHWTRQSRIEGYYECPEIFEMAVDGDPSQRKWVVYAADGDYAVGQFDGKTFTPESGKHRYHYGNCFYASQTFNDLPPHVDRRIQIAWGRVEMPGMPFNQMMLFPVELSLRTTEEGPRLFANPVAELGLLHEKRLAVCTPQPLREGENPLEGARGELLDVRVEFEPGEAAEVTLTLRGVPIVYDVRARQLRCEGCEAPLAPVNGRIRLQVLVDRTSVEIFGNDGRVYMPVGMILSSTERSLAITSRGGPAFLNALDAFALRSIWR